MSKKFRSMSVCALICLLILFTALLPVPPLGASSNGTPEPGPGPSPIPEEEGGPDSQGDVITSQEILRSTITTNNKLVGARIENRQTSDGGGSDSVEGSIPGSKFVTNFSALNIGKNAVLPKSYFVSALTGDQQPETSWKQAVGMALTSLEDQQRRQVRDESQQRFGVWAMQGTSLMSNDQTSTEMWGNVITLMGGFDYKPIDPLLVGLGVGWEHVYAKTKFNEGRIYGDGLTLMPYVSYAILPTTIIDSSFGLTFMGYNSRRYSDSSNSDIDSDYDSTRTLWAVNVNQYFLLDQWSFLARVSNLYANEYRLPFDDDADNSFGGANTYLGELQLATRATYSWERFSPYIGAAYILDYAIRSPQDTDIDEFQGSLGATARLLDTTYLTADVTNSFFRDHTTNTSFSFNLRYEW